MASAKADLVLRKAGAITLDRRFPRARTIYIQNGLILKVSSADIDRSLTGPDTGIIDCEGKTVIPAFHDAHCHVVAYAEGLVNVDVSPASVQSFEDIINKISKVAAATPAGQWIRCAGYNEFYLKERRHPLRYDLDRATLAHPVKLTHRSGHAHVLNTLALKLAGISNESEEPDGAMIERDLENGEPNGLLLGMGSYLSQRIPPFSGKDLDRAIGQAGNKLLSLGITSVQDASPGNDPRRWQQFADWKKRELFKLRTTLMFGAAETRQIKDLRGINGELSAGAVKLVLDEVRGKLNPSQSEINRMLLDIHKRGLQAAIHAVEENTVKAAIKALDYALNRFPRRDHRHRLEHCSVCSPAAASRLATLGAMVVTNPAFIYYSGERYLSDVPQGQFRRLYAINTMLGAGLRVAAGSDVPVAGPDPLKAIYAAVTRRAETGQPVLPGQSISVMDALRLFTSGAAYSCFREKQLGAISRGKYADLAVLNADPLRVKAEDLKDIKVEMTLLNGKVVYDDAA
jgi:predicted amidohydrolase YtcJ